MKKLIAYHGDQKIKDAILKQLEAHYLADEIVKGVYWENGKGCAVGCTLHSGNHIEYEDCFGIPLVLARLEDFIFERLPNNLSKEWPIRFMSSIEPGADLSQVWNKFAIFLLTDVTHGVINFTKNENIKNIITRISDLYKNPNSSIQEFKEMRAAAYAPYAAAADAAADAAYAAAYAADAAYADNAADAADAAADAAAYAAYAAYDAAAYAATATDAAAYAYAYAPYAAAYAADSYAAAAAAAAAARNDHIIWQAKKLIELLKSSEVL